MPAEKPTTVKLDESTKKEVLSALRDIKKSIAEETVRPKTVSDKMAAKLAETPGKGIFSALRESLVERGEEKISSFKKMLDPVNIVKSITGDSKLAGVLTAKALGRPEEDIRKEAGLESVQTTEQLVTQTSAPETIGGVTELLKTLNVIAVRVEAIAGAMGATPKVTTEGRLYKTTEKGAKFLGKEEAAQESAILNTLLDIKKSQVESVDLEKKIVDAEQEQEKIAEQNAKLAEEASDAAREAALEKTRPVSRPSLVGVNGVAVPSPKQPDGDGGSGFGGALATVAGVIGGAKAVGGVLKRGYGAAKKVGGKVLEKLGLRTAQAAAPALAEAGTKVAAEGAEVAAKTGTKVAAEGAEVAAKVGGKVAVETAAKTATKEGIKSKISKIIARKVPQALMGAVGKSVPVLGAALGIGMAVGRLVKGDLFGAGLEAVSGLGSAATAIPATVASLVRDVYTETYKIEPEKDPKVGERLPELQQMVQSAATDFLEKKGEGAAPPKPETPTPVPPTPTEEPKRQLSVEEWAESVRQRQKAMGLQTVKPGIMEPITRTDGEKLDQVSQDIRRTKEAPQMSKSAGGNVINNVVNNTQPQTVVMPGMPQPRTFESTWLRRQQQSYPAT